MRTTLTIDDDIARKLKERARREKKSFKETVNETLQRGLGSTNPPPDFVVAPHDSGFVAGIDPKRLNQLADELETDSFVAETHRDYS